MLEYRFEGGEVHYRWRADIAEFDMPLKIRTGDELHTIHPTTEWQSEAFPGAEEDWKPATDLFYIGTEEVAE